MNTPHTSDPSEAPRTPKQQRIQPESVIAAALEMLDADGLEHVTLRRLAARLGVQAPALYWHFKNKQDIVDEMAQAILAGTLADFGPPSDPADWEGWLRAMALTLRRALLSRRDGARIVAGAGLARASLLADLSEMALTTLSDAGFGLLDAAYATYTLVSYTFGYVIEEQSGYTPPPDLPQAMEILAAHYPKIAEVIHLRETISEDESYERGLLLVLAGVRARLAETATE